VDHLQAQLVHERTDMRPGQVEGLGPDVHEVARHLDGADLAAEAVGRVEDRHLAAPVRQGSRRHQAGDATADDGDPRWRRVLRHVGPCGEGGR
jgi:hypothetical protein